MSTHAFQTCVQIYNQIISAWSWKMLSLWKLLKLAGSKRKLSLSLPLPKNVVLLCLCLLQFFWRTYYNSKHCRSVKKAGKYYMWKNCSLKIIVSNYTISLKLWRKLCYVTKKWIINISTKEILTLVQPKKCNRLIL